MISQGSSGTEKGAANLSETITTCSSWERGGKLKWQEFT